jgi:hypothetical protein
VSEPTAPRLRLVKVIVQPVFVLDYATHLQDVVEAPKEIAAEAWPTYSGEQFPRELAEAQAALDARDPEGGPPRREARAGKADEPDGPHS